MTWHEIATADKCYVESPLPAASRDYPSGNVGMVVKHLLARQGFDITANEIMELAGISVNRPRDLNILLASVRRDIVLVNPAYKLWTYKNWNMYRLCNRDIHPNNIINRASGGMAEVARLGLFNDEICGLVASAFLARVNNDGKLMIDITSRLASVLCLLWSNNYQITFDQGFEVLRMQAPALKAMLYQVNNFVTNRMHGKLDLVTINNVGMVKLEQ